MKHGVILRTGDGLNFGQTVDIVDEMTEYNDFADGIATEYFLVQPHGEKKRYFLKKEFVQIAEDAYNYKTNPVIINPYY
jgi:hypothetical protein